MEGDYQETVRAGRDGLESHCLLLYSSGDLVKQQYFINQINDPEEQRKAKENLSRMARFGSVNVCRRKQVLKYFDESTDDDCSFCDICTVSHEKIRRMAHDQIKTYGVGKDKSKRWWRGIMEELISQEAVRQDSLQYHKNHRQRKSCTMP